MEGMETEINGGGAAVATKRQRRPSVRLGDIGGGTAAGDAHHLHHFYFSKPQSKSRPLRNPRSNKQTLAEDVNVNNNNNNGSNKKKKKTSSSGGSGSLENDEDGKVGDFGGGGGDGVAIGSSNIRGDLKSKRGITNAKVATSNWASSALNQNHKCVDDGVNRNFEPLNSDEELDMEEEEEEEEEAEKEDHQLVDDDDDDNATPMHSFDNDDNENNLDNGVLRERRRGVQIMEEMDPPTDVRNNGVRAWLNNLGLERYAPVFEIHEVDTEVLPLLTLDDLKDMGISAVGSRRKMYCSIQKLNKGFS